MFLSIKKLITQQSLQSALGASGVSMVAGATLHWQGLCALSQIGSFMRYLYTQAKISCDSQAVPTRHMDLKIL